MKHVSKCLVNVIAVDPGSSGGIAICAQGKVSAEAYESDEQITALVRNLVDEDTCRGNVVAYMEQVGGYIGKEQPGSHMFTFGNGYGYWRGLFDMAGIPCRLIPPQKWMRSTLPGVIGMEKGERKRALRAYAQSKHPAIKVTLAIADALVLLEYGCERETAGEPLVAIPSRADFASDKKRAKAWCKAAGWPVPKASGEVMAMVNYWRGIGSP